MITILSRFNNTFFGSDVDFRKKMLNMLAITGMFAGVLMGLSNIVTASEALSWITGFGVAVFSLGVLVFARATKHYRAACIVTIVVIFLGYFPYLFFSMGGIDGNKAINFVFAIVFTAYVLEGKLCWFMMLLLVLIYSGLAVYAYLNPESIIPMPSEFNRLIDLITSMIFVGFATSIVFILQLHINVQQQRKLGDQNALLEGANLSKTQFLANSSHEMRTPLTIISVNVQNAVDILEDMGDAVIDSEAMELLTDTQSEIMRLSRMVGGMRTLASVSEAAQRRKLNLSKTLHSTADVLQLHLHERGNTLEIAIEEELIVFGDADLIHQTVVNIIQNAHKHTESGTIKLRAVSSEGKISVSVSDDGVGIVPELLPQVFERGVTGGSGTGYGLYICKTVIESHGGEIWIESEPGKGAAVHFLLPNYEGQFDSNVL